MYVKTLQIIGTLLVTAGLAVGAIGAYRICTNLPLSDNKLWEEARKAVLKEEGTEQNPHRESLWVKVELDVWTSALKMTDKGRAQNRGEGTVFLFSGILSVIWGGHPSLQQQKDLKGALKKST